MIRDRTSSSFQIATAEVSEAVASLHDQSFVHGDIKLENIMIDADDNVKLVDFGLASFNYEAVSVVPF